MQQWNKLARLDPIENNIELGIFHKLTQTDMVLHFSSRHPEEHKIAVCTYMLIWSKSCRLQ
jgi:hypothetical protein